MSTLALPQALRDLIESAPLAHLATIGRDGAPQVTVVWIGLDGDQIVSGHMPHNEKIRNLERDPRFVLSFDAPQVPGEFLQHHAVLHGEATIQRGGAFDLLDRLAKRYVGPEASFPGDPRPGGFVVRYDVRRIGGRGPWVDGA